MIQDVSWAVLPVQVAGGGDEDEEMDSSSKLLIDQRKKTICLPIGRTGCVSVANFIPQIIGHSGNGGYVFELDKLGADR